MLSPQNAISAQVQVWEEQEFSFTFSRLPFSPFLLLWSWDSVNNTVKCTAGGCDSGV